MARITIAVDIDEVLAPLHSIFLAHHNSVYGTNYEAPDPGGRYFLNEIGNYSEEETLEKLQAFVKSEDFRAIRPLEGAVDAIKQLSAKHKLAIVTSRQDFYQEFTYEWLEEHFPELFNTVNFTAHVINQGPKVSKSVIAKQLGASHLIDDNFSFVIDAASAGLKAILFGDYPWNRSAELPPGVTRCEDWPAVLEYFDAAS